MASPPRAGGRPNGRLSARWRADRPASTMYTITLDADIGCVVTFAEIVTLGERVRALEELADIVTHSDPCRWLVDIADATLPLGDLHALLEFFRRAARNERPGRLALLQGPFQFDQAALSSPDANPRVEAFEDRAAALAWLSPPVVA